MSIKLDQIFRDYGDFNLKVNLDIPKGELISLLGPSGCGKSTTLRIIAGFEEADSGSILIDDRDVKNVPAEKRNIGMVFQDYALFPHMTVFENIAYGPRIRKWDKKRIETSVKRFLKIVHLEGMEKRRTDKLSGGEQQRVALARALVTEPQLLLLDEPLSALDAKLRKGLRKEIRRIQRDLGITTIYVTHDQEEALAISDRIAVMNDGRCLQYDRPEMLYRKPSHIFSAGFVGNSNLISLKSVNREDRTVSTVLGDFSVDFITENSVPEKLFFRPDKCRIISSISEINTFRATVTDREYTGSLLNLEVESENQIMTVSVPEDSEINSGQEIYIQIPQEYCRVL